MAPPFNFNNLAIRNNILDTDWVIIQRGSAAGSESKVAFSILRATIGAAGGDPVVIISSVNGLTGAVVLTTANINEASDRLYFTLAERQKLQGIAAGAGVNPAIATQADAVAGTDQAKMMTPLRVAQAIAALAGGGATASTKETIPQVGHGFSVKQAVFNNNGTWVLAKADSETTARVDGIVESVPNSSSFVVVTGGKASFSGLTPNAQYYLSANVAGQITTTQPTAANHWLVPVLRAGTSTVGYVKIGDPITLAQIPVSALERTIPLNKYDGTVAPTVDNDVTEGYSAGSEWYNGTTGTVYKCVSATEGAAVWVELN